MTSPRPPQYAGKFYAAGEKEVLKEIAGCFNDKTFGPLSLTAKEKKEKGRIVGIIAPHAGYVYSGACAACAYDCIPVEDDTTFVVLATNHTGMGRTSLAELEYETPLGAVRTDKECVDFLLANNVLVRDQLSHAYEHSLEVQLPFIQYLYGMKKKRFSIVPIVVSSILTAEQLAEGLKRMVKRFREKKFCFIASSDFTHQGPDYGYRPYTTDVAENIRKLDQGAIEYILKLDGIGFHKYIQKTGATICGYLPIYVLVNVLKRVAAVEGRVLKHYTSGDVVKEYTNSVSYAAIVFREKK